MGTYYKPQSPIQSGEDFIYPITTADQIMKSDNSRRLEQAGLIVADNSTSLGGVAAKDYALKTDTAPDSSKLGGKAPEYYLQPRNLLDNSDWERISKIVNQRGQTSYTGGYTIDRWVLYGTDKLTINHGYITVSGDLYQYIPADIIPDGMYTVCACKRDGTIVSFSRLSTAGVDWHNGLAFGLDSSGEKIAVGLRSGEYVWAALYEGEYTADNLPPYVPKGYAAELAACNSAPVSLNGGYGGGSLQAYPVGSIYMSVNSTSPASLFGGTWEQIKGRFLLGTGAPENNDDGTSPGNYDKTPGSKNGEAAHTLTTNEMPSHTHEAVILYNQSGYGHTSKAWEMYLTATSGSGWSSTEGTAGTITNANTRKLRNVASTGGGAAHNNMPPYLAVYMWERVS